MSTFRERLTEGLHHYGDWGEHDTERLIDKAVSIHEDEVKGRAAIMNDQTRAMAEMRKEIKRLEQALKEANTRERKALSLFRAAIAQNETPTP